jgi:hypothetical protein
VSNIGKDYTKLLIGAKTSNATDGNIYSLDSEGNEHNP